MAKDADNDEENMKVETWSNQIIYSQENSKPEKICLARIKRIKLIHLPMCGFADSWMTKASEAPTCNAKKNNNNN